MQKAPTVFKFYQLVKLFQRHEILGEHLPIALSSAKALDF
tara:strand:+ start:2938 stop:3057 length:120 start_codon:yes stop_codon:yes gene_type:complete